MGNVCAVVAMLSSATGRLHDVQGQIARLTRAREALLMGSGTLGIFGSLLGLNNSLFDNSWNNTNSLNNTSQTDKAKEQLDKFLELEIQRLQTLASMLEKEIEGANKGIDKCMENFAPKFA